jgi:hypothetical protein
LATRTAEAVWKTTFVYFVAGKCVFFRLDDDDERVFA